jgi:aspartyl-tRNA(Asn)/glutamyl-tRNA(Gln) amidotransferase subunit A
LEDLYKKTRTENFGNEVKRRINLGNYVLSSGFFDAYYGSAKNIQRSLRASFAEAFKKCDIIIIPTSPGAAPTLNYKDGGPLYNYLLDLFTTVSNITGTPALSIPFGNDKAGMPLGIQILGDAFTDDNLYEAARRISEVQNGK